MINKVFLISAARCGKWQNKGECNLQKGKSCGKGFQLQERKLAATAKCSEAPKERKRVCKISCRKKNKNNKKQSLTLEGCKYVTKRASSCLEEQEYELVKHNSTTCIPMISKLVSCKACYYSITKNNCTDMSKFYNITKTLIKGKPECDKIRKESKLCPAHGGPPCKYQKSKWSDCDLRTFTKERVRQLKSTKRISDSKCRKEIVEKKPCIPKKILTVCKYNATKISKAVKRLECKKDGRFTRSEILNEKESSKDCPFYIKFIKPCKRRKEPKAKCFYDKKGGWTPCTLHKRSVVGALRGNENACSKEETIVESCN
ncbi:DgyrCDS5954 [Dimorphilus gyrociliatus]|uniref:DgyrCDS5954 n=1 Tax=Dimorphilus gyrociliatus TaxID=2664684 RepID=A0A7I8VMA5_9ANNE|nr:DgyrCDS5954 [Dimorphilus gyrociliatus]